MTRLAICTAVALVALTFSLLAVGLTGCGGGSDAVPVAATFQVVAEYFAADGHWYCASSDGSTERRVGPFGDWRFRVEKRIAPVASGSTGTAGGGEPVEICFVTVVNPDGSDGRRVLPDDKDVYYLECGDYHVIAKDIAGKWLAETRVHVTG